MFLPGFGPRKQRQTAKFRLLLASTGHGSIPLYTALAVVVVGENQLRSRHTLLVTSIAGYRRFSRKCFSSAYFCSFLFFLSLFVALVSFNTLLSILFFCFFLLFPSIRFFFCFLVKFRRAFGKMNFLSLSLASLTRRTLSTVSRFV